MKLISKIKKDNQTIRKIIKSIKKQSNNKILRNKILCQIKSTNKKDKKG